MAKNKKPQQQDQTPEPSKGIVASIVDAVDHVLHPDHAAEKTEGELNKNALAGESAPAPQTDVAAGKQSSAPESETDHAAMQDHPKFDKFNGGIS